MANILTDKRVLCIGAHPDDVELGMGATMARYANLGWKVICLTDCHRFDEFADSMKELTISQAYCYAYNWHRFDTERQEILNHLYNLRMDWDVVFVPMLGDVHQDHQVLTTEAIRAFKGGGRTILGYELPWNRVNASDLGIEVSEANIERKFNALRQYVSEEYRTYMGRAFISSLSIVRGQQFGFAFAEAFQVIQMAF